MPLQYITIDQKKHPVHFGHWALSLIQDELNIKDYSAIFEADVISNPRNQFAIAAIGMNEGSRQEKKESNYTAVDIADLCDNSPQILLDIFAIFTKQVIDLSAKKIGGDEKKFKEKVNKKIKESLSTDSSK